MSQTTAPGRLADPLFLGATRPPMRWGVTYAALLFNLMFTMEAFLLSRNLLTLTLCVPVHGLCALLCARDVRFFDLLLLWGRTRLPALLGNLGVWRAASYSPLELALPGRGGLRPRCPVCLRMRPGAHPQSEGQGADPQSSAPGAAGEGQSC